MILRLCLPMALAATPVLFTPALAETQVLTLSYLCDRGVEIPATYVNAEDQSLAVIHVEGRQITLYNEVSASGARYGWPSDGAGYVWWTKGPEATLYWKEGGEEVPLLTCAEAQQ